MIVDFHTHILPPEIVDHRAAYLTRDAWFRELYSDPQAKLATVEQLIAEMDRSGVAISVTFGFGWADPGLCRLCNDYVLEAMARYPGRLVGLVSVNPRYAAESLSEIERCFQAGMKGIGELMPNGQGYDFDDVAVMRPIVEAVGEGNGFILVHGSEPLGHHYPGKGTVTPDIIYRAAQAFPGTRIVCAHWGGGLPFYEAMPEVRHCLSHVYYDTAASLYLYRDQIFSLLDGLVGDKVLFATDYPLTTQRRFLRRVERAAISATAKERLLGGNALRLLQS